MKLDDIYSYVKDLLRKLIRNKFLFSLTEKKYSETATDIHVNHSSSPELLPNGVKKVSVRSAWEKNKSVSYEQCKPTSVAPHGNDFEYTAKIRTLAETERFFDELTKEKDQVKTNKT